MKKGESVSGEMEKHLTEQIGKIRKGQYTSEGFHRHLVECHQFCGLLMNKILAANTSEIAKLPHDVVFFEFDKDLMAPRYQKDMQDFANKNRNLPIHLVGRASYIGTGLYDKDLSARRAKRVPEFLTRAGISEDQIKPYWLGYEAPQLTRELADSYGIDPQEYRENLFNLNQSVVMFAYPLDMPYPTVISTIQQELRKKKPPGSPNSRKHEERN